MFFCVSENYEHINDMERQVMSDKFQAFKRAGYTPEKNNFPGSDTGMPVEGVKLQSVYAQKSYVA
jgi:hypothetical protein